MPTTPKCSAGTNNSKNKTLLSFVVENKETKQCDTGCPFGSQDFEAVGRHACGSVRVGDAAPSGGPRTHYVDKMARQDAAPLSGLFLLAAAILCTNFHIGLVKGRLLPFLRQKLYFYLMCHEASLILNVLD